MADKKPTQRDIAVNRRARHDYFVEETHEAGIVLTGKVKERGFTLIPLRLYFKHGRAKVELGLCRGKKQYDKRATIREREMRREVDRARRVR